MFNVYVKKACFDEAFSTTNNTTHYAVGSTQQPKIIGQDTQYIQDSQDRQGNGNNRLSMRRLQPMQNMMVQSASLSALILALAACGSGISARTGTSTPSFINIDLDDKTDTGSSKTDDITNTSKPSFKLDGLPNAKVKVEAYRDGETDKTLSFNTQLDSQGKASVDLPEGWNMKSGSWTVTARVNGDVSAQKNIIIDRDAPSNAEVKVDGQDTMNINRQSVMEKGITVKIESNTMLEATLKNAKTNAVVKSFGSQEIAADQQETTLNVDQDIQPDTTYTLTTKITDEAGNVRTSEHSITTAPGRARISLPDEGKVSTDYIGREGLNINGTTGEKVTIAVKEKGTETTVSEAEGIIGSDGSLILLFDDGDVVLKPNKSYDLVTTVQGQGDQTETFVVDMQTTLSPNIILQKNSDTGKSHIDRVTSDTSPTFTITGQANDKITVTASGSNGQSIAMREVTLDDEGVGQISFPQGAFAEGFWTIAASGSNGNDVTSVRFDVSSPVAPSVTLTNTTSLEGSPSYIVSKGIMVVGEPGASVSFKMREDGVEDSGTLATLTGDLDQSGQLTLMIPSSVTLDYGKSYVLDGSIMDASGNVSTFSNVITATPAPTIALSPGSDGGISRTDGITSKTGLAFDIKAVKSSTLEVVATGPDGKELSSQQAIINKMGDGTVVYSDGTFSDGVWKIMIKDQGSVVNSIDVTVDTTPLAIPDITVANRVSLSTGNKAVLDNGLTVVSEAGARVSITFTDEMGKTITLRDTLDSDGRATLMIPEDTVLSSDKYYTITGTIEDIGGNKTPIDTLLTITSSPQVKLSENSNTGRTPDDNRTNTARPDFTIEHEANGVVLVKLTSADSQQTQEQQIILDNEGRAVLSFSDFALTEGRWVITVANDESESTFSFTVDTTPPLAPKISLAGKASQEDGQPLMARASEIIEKGFAIEGGASDEVTLMLKDGDTAIANVSIVLDNTGKGTLLLPSNVSSLDAGKTYDIEVNTVDQSGNTTATKTSLRTASIAVLSVATDSDTGVSNSDGITKDNNPSLQLVGYAKDTVTVIAIDPLGDRETFTTTLDETGTGVVNYGNKNLIDGTWVFTVSSTIGESRTEVIIDTTNPSAPDIMVTGYTSLEAPKGDIISNGLTIKSNDFGAAIMLMINDGETLIAQVMATLNDKGEAVLSFPDDTTLMSNKDYQITGTIEDKSGNSVSFTSTLSTTPAPTVSLEPSYDTGESDSDGITNGTRLSFIVKGQANAVVSVSANGPNGAGVASVDITLDGNGRSMIMYPESSFADGDWSFTATSSSGEATTSITVDTVINQVEDLTVSGYNNTLRAPANEVLANGFTLKGEAGAKVTLTLSNDDGMVSSAVGRVDSQGNATLILPSDTNIEENASYGLSVSITDVAGNNATLDSRLITTENSQALVIPQLDDDINTAVPQTEFIDESETLIGITESTPPDTLIY